jgi:hypothetical protein
MIPPGTPSRLPSFQPKARYIAGAANGRPHINANPHIRQSLSRITGICRSAHRLMRATVSQVTNHITFTCSHLYSKIRICAALYLRPLIPIPVCRSVCSRRDRFLTGRAPTGTIYTGSQTSKAGNPFLHPLAGSPDTPRPNNTGLQDSLWSGFRKSRRYGPICLMK